MNVVMQAWSTVRGKGKRIPSGGTLVIGREQDCPGGCFDSHQGAAGQTQRLYELEYGAQDFIGVMDEIRIWSTVRSQAQIQEVCPSPALNLLGCYSLRCYRSQLGSTYVTMLV